MDSGKEQAECAKMWKERRTINKKNRHVKCLSTVRLLQKKKSHVTVLLHTSAFFPLFAYVFPSLRSAQVQPENRQGKLWLVRSPVCTNWQKEKKNLLDSLGTPGDLWCSQTPTSVFSTFQADWNSEGIDSRFQCDVAAFYPDSQVLGYWVENKAITSQLFQNRWYLAISLVSFASSSTAITH